MVFKKQTVVNSENIVILQIKNQINGKRNSETLVRDR